MRRIGLLLGMCAAASGSNAMWSQDEDEVVVYVTADCDMDGHDLTVAADRFAFACTAGGNAVAVEFVPREDLVAGKGACAKSDDRVLCTVSKFHAGHLWDRLTWDDAEWTYAGKQTESYAYLQTYDHVYDGHESSVKSYSPRELDRAVADYDAVFACVKNKIFIMRQW